MNEIIVNRIIIISTFISVFLYCGPVFGWTALQSILKRDNVYLNECTPPLTTCDAQDTQLSYIYTLNVAGIYISLCLLYKNNNM